MPYNTYLFDIDGTLCDPGPSIIDSARYALAEIGITVTDETELRRFVGPPLEHAFRDYYDFDPVKTAHAVDLFRQKLQRDGIKLYKPYPGIIELLEALQKSDKNIAVVTSKIEHIARDALKSTALLKFFDIIGAQQPNEVVDKKVVLARVLDRLKVTNTSGIAMIGDRKHDIEAAKACNVESIGVLWGYGSRDELVDESATHIVTHPKEILSL